MNLSDEQCELIGRTGLPATALVEYLDFVSAGFSPREGVVCAGGCGMMVKVGPDLHASYCSMAMIPEMDNMVLCPPCYGAAQRKGSDLKYNKMKEVWEPWL